MKSWYDVETQLQIFEQLGKVLVDLQTQINGLRKDFLHHRHSLEAGKYDPTLIGFNNDKNKHGGGIVSSQDSVVELPPVPLVGENWLK